MYCNCLEIFSHFLKNIVHTNIYYTFIKFRSGQYSNSGQKWLIPNYSLQFHVSFWCTKLSELSNSSIHYSQSFNIFSNYFLTRTMCLKKDISKFSITTFSKNDQHDFGPFLFSSELLYLNRCFGHILNILYSFVEICDIWFLVISCASHNCLMY